MLSKKRMTKRVLNMLCRMADQRRALGEVLCSQHCPARILGFYGNEQILKAARDPKRDYASIDPKFCQRCRQMFGNPESMHYDEHCPCYTWCSCLKDVAAHALSVAQSLNISTGSYARRIFR
jgi:hypothetical protein